MIRRLMKTGFLAFIFLIIAAIGFVSSFLIFFSAWTAQVSSPDYMIRGALYFFSSVALLVIARRDYHRQKARNDSKDEL